LLGTGQEQIRKGRYREAASTFRKAVRLDPEAPEPYIRLALIHEECLADPATALRYYREYERVEKDVVKREEVRGWIVQLERSVGESGEGGRGAEPSAARAGRSGGPASENPVPRASLAGDPSPPVQKDSAHRDLQARLASALEEIRQLRSQKSPESALLRKLSEAEQKARELETQNRSLSKNLQDASADALASQQAARESEKRSSELRSFYAAQIANLKERLNAAEAELRNFRASQEDVRAAELLRELREAKRQRDSAQAEQRKATDEIAGLKKTVEAHAATISSLRKSNDGLTKENASLRSRLSGRGGRLRYHTVRAGETLKTIAGYRSVYGDRSMWVLIYEANKDNIRDPNRLKPGLVLVIPPG
jgi:nucleoid-associated protein YgaU